MTDRAHGGRTGAGLAGLALALALGGCSMFGPPDEISVACPTTGVLAQGERLERYRSDGDRDLTDLVIRAGIGNIRKACSIRQEERLLEMDVLLQVFTERGPAAAPGEILPVEYFVAVVDEDDKVRQRQQFKLAAAFEGNARQAVFDEQLFLTIPIDANGAVSDFRVVIGLQLTPAELDRALAAENKRR